MTTRIAAVLDGGQPDAPTAALISIVNAIDLLPKIFPQRDKKTMRRRAKQIGELAGAGRRSRRPSRRSRPRSPPQ